MTSKHSLPYWVLPLVTCAVLGVSGAFGKSAPPASPAHRFAPPTALDSLLDANPPPMPAIKPAEIRPEENSAPPAQTASADAAASPASPELKTTGIFFQIQLGAISDIDSAQARKAELELSLRSKIDMVFDPPFYKLRYGNFASKQEAEDALADLAEKNLQGFVVRQ